MRQLGFALGVVLLVLGAAALVAQVLHLAFGEGYTPVSLGSMWYAVHGNSLVGFQALIEKSLGGAVWAPLQFLLTVPAWISLVLPGALLALLCRPRQRGLAGF